MQRIICCETSNTHKASFEHFVLFAGLQEGRAKIFDGTNDVAKWSLADVASRWDGKALVLSTSAVHVKELGAPSRRQRRNWSVAIAGAIGILCATQSQIRGSRLGAVGTSAIGIVILIATAGYAAWVFHAKTPTGFIACPGTVDAVRAANASTFLPNINVAAVQSLLKSGDAIFIDARSAENFSEGHLPGALNLQGFLPPRAARQIADLIPKGRRLVVYCANAKCPLSKATAQRLIEAGHDDVVIYPGGWNEWRDRAGTTADARQP